MRVVLHAAMSALQEEALRGRLPSVLAERIRVAKAGVVSSGYVLYWMRLALRGHENPALDAAICAANALKVPAIVLLHLEDIYPHATSRRQMFLLQGALHAQKELEHRGIPTIVQVDREGNRPDTITTLAKSASLVVAEEPFCVPWLAGVEHLQNGSFTCPVWLSDCSSVVPSVLVPRQSSHRAYQFENATKHLHASRVSQIWNDLSLHEKEAPAFVKQTTLDLEACDLPALVAEMDVDHSVKLVEHTQGGSSHGYKRWAAWVEGGGLKTYAKRRNESLDVHGVSRMSAYLNAGMVSPLRLAREASSAKGAGVGKFLNEYLTWRGLSYAWCYHYPMPASGCTLSQLPSWASQTLKDHASDARRVISRELLARASSNDVAWDGMQRYLVETGELHNNARMGWGCAIAKWTSSPEDALRMLIDLNNTFALDGHAPPSYAGLLGCLGLFSGPGREAPVVGKVSMRAPKSKYSALPMQIPTLLVGATPGTDRKVPEESLGQGSLRAFLVNKQVDPVSPSTHGQAPANDHDTPPPKRRWQKLHVDQIAQTLIDID